MQTDKPNTLVPYLYRDANNYKVWNECVVSGRITDEQIHAIRDALMDGENFIPSMVGMPENKFDDTTEDDVDTFELLYNRIEPTDRTDAVITVDELVENFRAAKSHGWEE